MFMSMIKVEKVRSVLKQSKKDTRFLKFLNDSRNQGFYNDVRIKIQDKYFPANRVILSCFSDFFQNHFNNEIEKEKQEIVEVNSVEEESMKLIIEFMYTGRILLNDENVFNVLASADYLQVDKIKELCFYFLEYILTNENCFDLLDVSDLYNNEGFKLLIYMKIFSVDFDAVKKHPQFVKMSVTSLMNSIANLDRGKVKEAAIYDAVVKWTKHDEKARKQHFVELFQLIDLNRFPLEFLRLSLATEKLVEDDLLCLKLVKNVLTKLCVEKNIRETGSKIISIGGSKSNSEVQRVYSILSQEVTKYPKLPVDIICHAVLYFEKTFYCIGGRSVEDQKSTNRAWKMNLRKSPLEWEPIGTLIESRSLAGAAVFDDVLVISGGLSEVENSAEQHKQFSSTEIYHKEFDEWTTICPMQQLRAGHAMVSCAGCLLSIGGYVNDEVLSSVEKLTAFTSEWEFTADLLTPRKRFAAVSCKDKVYAIGGQTVNGKQLRSVEKFDPEVGKWIYVKDLNVERSGHSACVLQDKIYVVGGNLSTSSKEVVPAHDIECYDPSNDEWTIVLKLKKDLLDHQIVGL